MFLQQETTNKFFQKIIRVNNKQNRDQQFKKLRQQVNINKEILKLETKMDLIIELTSKMTQKTEMLLLILFNRVVRAIGTNKVEEKRVKNLLQSI